ncbi:MAG: helix-hairpin-helix domain-containing protein [Syntrophaceae bacterium]
MMKKVLTTILIISFSLVFISAFSFATDTESVVKLTQMESAPLVNVNAADKTTLMSLPGITDTYAQKIIDGRPYKKKEELKTRNIIPASVYNKIKNKITVINLA